MKSRKKFLILIITLTALFSGTTTAYASGPTYTKADYVQMIRDLVTQYFDPASKDYDIGMKLADGVSLHYDELDQTPTALEAERIIGEISTNAFNARSTGLFADSNASLFYSEWKNVYLEDAESYGVNTVGAYGELTIQSMFSAWGVNPLGYNNTTTQDLANKSEHINILTWNNKTTALGTRVSATDEGKMSQFLTTLTTQFDSFMSVIAAIAVALTVAFGCANLIQMSGERTLSIDALTREFLKIMIGVWLVLNYRFFALLIIRLGTLVNELILKTNLQEQSDSMAAPLLVSSLMKIINANAATGLTSLQVQISTGNAATVLAAETNGLLITKLINSLGSATIVQTVLQFTIYVVAIEVGIRYIFTPIAIADLYSEKYRSNGFLWLKKLFAVTIQGALVFLVMYGSNALKQAVGGFGGAQIAINCATLGMFATSKLIANEIVGVR